MKDRGHGHGGGNSNPIQVQKFLGGLDYPATKSDILDRAKDEGADERVMSVLQRIPEQSYHKPMDVSRAVGER
jgi:hypothetical protein